MVKREWNDYEVEMLSDKAVATIFDVEWYSYICIDGNRDEKLEDAFNNGDIDSDGILKMLEDKLEEPLCKVEYAHPEGGSLTLYIPEHYFKTFEWKMEGDKDGRE